MDIVQWGRKGWRPGDIRAAADEAGVRIAVVDPLTTWLADRRAPPTLDTNMVAFGDFGVEEVFDMACAVGADTVTALEWLGNRVPTEVGARSLATACAKAEERGLRVALEATPFSGIPDLRSACAIVEAAGGTAGLVIDSWHVLCGRRPADNLVLMEKIDPERIISVQLSDAPLVRKRDLRSATYERMLPGDGDLDLARFVRVLESNAARPRYIGPEVLSKALWEMPPDELGRRLRHSMSKVLEQSRLG